MKTATNEQRFGKPRIQSVIQVICPYHGIYYANNSAESLIIRDGHSLCGKLLELEYNSAKLQNKVARENQLLADFEAGVRRIELGAKYHISMVSVDKWLENARRRRLTPPPETQENQ